jgi:hypothetical protein
MLYDRAMILVAQTEFPGTWESGWSRVNWQLPTLSNGVYFAVFSTGETQQDKPGILVVLHWIKEMNDQNGTMKIERRSLNFHGASHGGI